MIQGMAMLEIVRSSQFKKDLKKIIKRGKNLTMLERTIKTLQSNKPLSKKNCDHSLVGEWQGYRECHINPDWLLIYKIDSTLKLLRLARTGSHSDLFR